MQENRDKYKWDSGTVIHVGGVRVGATKGAVKSHSKLVGRSNHHFTLEWHVRNIKWLIWREKENHYIYTSRSLSYKPACLGCSLHKHRTAVATPLVTYPAWSRNWGKGTMFCVDTVDIGKGENPQSVRPNRGSPRYGPMPRPNRPSSYSPTSQVVHLPFGASLLHCRSSISM